ncbi:MAG: magnesium transporter [Bacillota bacterium]|nr:magnesium transporter [Bacillota bacterium]
MAQRTSKGKKDLNGIINLVKQHLAREDLHGITLIANEIQAADLAEVLAELKLEERVWVFVTLDNEKAAAVLNELDPRLVSPLLQALGAERVADIFEEMPSDDAADLLGELTEAEKKRLLTMMEVEDAADVEELLVYPEDTAGGIMTTEYVAIRQDITVGRAIEVLRETAPDAETIYYVYVINERGQLVGVISLRELIVASLETRIEQIMHRKVISVSVLADQEEVARVISKYDFLAVPVVDLDQVLVGIVTVDDVIDVIEEEATEDIYKLASSGEPEDLEMTTSFWRRAQLRLPWLLALLFGQLLASRVIDNFTNLLQVVTTLAVFITVMAGQAGNAATQSLAIVVRGLATGNLDRKRVFFVVLREAKVGITVGLICGIVLAAVGYLWLHNAALAITLGSALSINIFVGVILGTFIPLVIDRIGLDPALASGPFITTLTDIVSMAVYFSLAVLIFSLVVS